MLYLTKSQKARMAIQSFKTIAHALAIRGFYRPSEKMGQSLAECLENLEPEIYGSMNDPRVVELKGLEYVIDRMPRGIENCIRIILTEEEEFSPDFFEYLVSLKRRRTCYRISDKEICFVITRGLSEIYDILAHITFLHGEAKKIRSRMRDEAGDITVEWKQLENTVTNLDKLKNHELEQAVWNLSLILGRPYHQTRESYDHFEKNRIKHNSNNGLFSLIYHLGKRMDEEIELRDNALIIYLTPSLMKIIGHQKYGEIWAMNIKNKLAGLGLEKRPIHIISANLHSILNLIYGWASVKDIGGQFGEKSENLYDFIKEIKDKRETIINYAKAHGFYEIPDMSGTHIDCQIIDTALVDFVSLHPDLNFNIPNGEKPVLLVMDYAFGIQAFEVMDNLLNPFSKEDEKIFMNINSISVMGKAGILAGKKGDIMLATAHVIEGSSDNYIFENDLSEKDFNDNTGVYKGPMITVVGTSLQNRDMLRKFQESWHTIGLEMEGGHYQRAISAAIIKGHIQKEIKVRYAYYASDNPLVVGETLASGEMGEGGIRPTYMVTKVILEKIFNG